MVLQVTVEILIRVMFRTVRRKKEDLYLFFVFVQPGRNDLAMVRSQIIQNEKHLLTDVFYQAGHEFDKEGRCHGFSIQHESDFAGIGDRGDHVDAAFLSAESNHRWCSFGGESLGIVGGVLNTRLISPVDHGFLMFGSNVNLRIFHVQPGLDLFGVLLVGSLHRLLRSESPPLRIVGDSPHGWTTLNFFMIDRRTASLVHRRSHATSLHGHMAEEHRHHLRPTGETFCSCLRLMLGDQLRKLCAGEGMKQLTKQTCFL